MNKPLLFDYATSELSQDAFIAWLLAYGDRQYSGAVHEFSLKVLTEMFKLSNLEISTMDLDIKVWRQYQHIDVFCEINDNKIALIIEDKVYAATHGDQLYCYREGIEKEEKYEKIVAVYLKTGDQSNYEYEKKAGYTIVKRENLIEWFKSAEGVNACNENSIVNDFKCHLESLEGLTQGYLIDPIDKWDWNAWKGFYMALQSKLKDANWDYVPNPSGGFMGLWWYWRQVPDGHVYLQLEEKKACFKFEVADDAQDRKQDLKWDWNSRICSAYESLKDNGPLQVVKPPVLRVGQWMTVAILSKDYRVADCSGKLDLEATFKNLQLMQNVLEKATEDYKE